MGGVVRNVLIAAAGALLGSPRIQGFRAESFDRLLKSAGR